MRRCVVKIPLNPANKVRQTNNYIIIESPQSGRTQKAGVPRESPVPLSGGDH